MKCRATWKQICQKDIVLGLICVFQFSSFLWFKLTFINFKQYSLSV